MHPVPAQPAARSASRAAARSAPTRRQVAASRFIKLACHIAHLPLPGNAPLIAQVPFTLDLPENLFHGPKQRTKITVHKPIRPGDPEFKDVATLRKHCFDTVMVSFTARLRAHQGTNRTVVVR